MVEITDKQKKEILKKHRALGAPRDEWDSPGTKIRRFNKKDISLEILDYEPEWDSFENELFKSDKAMAERIIKNIFKKLPEVEGDTLMNSRFLKDNMLTCDFRDGKKIRNKQGIQYYTDQYTPDLPGHPRLIVFHKISIKIREGKRIRTIPVGFVPAEILEEDTGNSYDTTGSILVAIQNLFDNDDRALLTRHHPKRDITCCTVDLPKTVAEWFDYDDRLDAPNPREHSAAEIDEIKKYRWGHINYGLLNRISADVRRASDLADYPHKPED